MSKPFKMKGSPMQRNFGIGKPESTESPSPYNKNSSPNKGLQDIDLKRALAAGMDTLPGGHNAYNSTKDTEYERDENGKLIMVDGKPIPKPSDNDEHKVYSIKNLFDDVTNVVSKKNKENTEENTEEEAETPLEHSVPDHHLAKNQHGTGYKGGSDKGRFKKKKK